ncbi:hypothetical protein HD554DRAFT_2169147 [Boletus coccyginus]|nr:hypothetical protein HD554DRAFT_2169147 [Boletus coccyginus]
MDSGMVEDARGSLVLVVNVDMDERSELSSSMLQHGLAPRPASRTPSPSLPDIPAADLDLTFSFNSIMGTNASAEPHVERVQKRASNVLKLTQENEKLKEELRAMTARLEAAERRRQEIAHRQEQQTQQQVSFVANTATHPARSKGSS